MPVSTFPSDWPHECPPASAEDANTDAYRIVRASPPTADDFKNHYELGREKSPRRCRARALSVFRSKEEARKAWLVLRYLGDHFASGRLRPIHGKTMLAEGTHPGHLEWWPYEGVDPAAVLTKVEKAG